MYTEELATKVLHFSAGHRVMNHEGACKMLHGHNYEVHITASADKLDDLGRVIDFSVLKAKIGAWIDFNWDHKFILFKFDSEAIEAVKQINGMKGIALLEWNPTAENIAKYLLEVVGPSVLADTLVELVEVTVWETRSCYATARRKS